MTITKTLKDHSLLLALDGRLDTATSPELESELSGTIADLTELTFDCANLEYISSAGLRVLLSAQKQMNKQGTMCLINVNEDVKDVFDITGFCDILTIL